MRTLILAISVVLVTGCIKDKPPDPVVLPSSPGGSKVYVVNEGGLSNANGSITQFDPAGGEVIPDLYRTRNNSGVGDIPQSMSFMNGSFYIVVNKSGKLLICDPSLKKKAEIALTSPRYLLALTNKKAYVSDLESNAISVVDLSNYSKTTEIRCPGWTEKMAMIYSKVYVTNMKKEYVYII